MTLFRRKQFDLTADCHAAGNLGALQESSKALNGEGVPGYYATLRPMHF